MDVRRVFWYDGDTLKVLDWYMRFFGLYDLQHLEDIRGKCAFAKLMAVSAILGPYVSKQARAVVLEQAHVEGLHARKVWLDFYENRTENIIRDGGQAVLTIFNQDASIRMQFTTENFCYDDIFATRETCSSAPCPLRTFMEAFYLSLEPDAPLYPKVGNTMTHLFNDELSSLFDAYGWKLEINGEVYAKD